MATAYSQVNRGSTDRRVRTRQHTVEEALDHAVDMMTVDGAGALSISEVARRMGIRPPSLYKYFDSLHAMYDQLFARGLRGYTDAVTAAVASQPRGVARIRAAMRAGVAWSVEHPALAQLLYWRPVPGFTPSPAVFADSVDQMHSAREELAEAVRLGELSASADSDDAVRMLTVVISGLITQQMANEPGVPFAEGRFSQLTDRAIEAFLDAYRVRPVEA